MQLCILYFYLSTLINYTSIKRARTVMSDNTKTGCIVTSFSYSASEECNSVRLLWKPKYALFSKSEDKFTLWPNNSPSDIYTLENLFTYV